MKSLTKVVTGMSVATLSIMLAGAVNADAAAPTINAGKTIEIKKGDMVSFDAVKKDAANPKAKWDLYEKDCTADISSLKTAKDTYFSVKSGVDIYHFKVTKDSLGKFKATFDGKDIVVTQNGTKVETATLKTNYQWRTDNSNWTAFKDGSTNNENDWSAYTMQGATIYIRYIGNPTGDASNAIKGLTSSSFTKEDATGINANVIPADSFAMKEFKVKITKKANAPAIGVDYVKGIIKKNTKARYKVLTNASTAVTVTGVLDSTTAEWKTMEADYAIAEKYGVILMQIPEDTAKKKPASKVAAFGWEAVAAPTVTSYTTSGGSPAAATSSSDAKTSGTLVGDNSTKDVEWKMTPNAKVEKTTFELTNNSKTVTYEIYTGTVGTTTSTFTTSATKAAATIKPGQTVKLNAAKLPACEDVSKAGNKAFAIRVAGDKKAGTVPGLFTAPLALKYLSTADLEKPKA